MYKLYNDTEKELFFSDYKPIPELSKLNCTELNELLQNLYDAFYNAFIHHSELLENGIYEDIVTTQKYRIEQYIITCSSGHIAIIINNDKYIEIDKAIMYTMKHLQEKYTEDSYFIDMYTDIDNIDKFIQESYKKSTST